MAHCKPPYSCGLLVFSIIYDANDNTHIMAFAHVKSEDTDNWAWFYRNSVEAFPSFTQYEGLVTISDQDKVTVDFYSSSLQMNGELKGWCHSCSSCRACGAHSVQCFPMQHTGLAAEACSKNALEWAKLSKRTSLICCPNHITHVCDKTLIHHARPPPRCVWASD